MHISRMSCVLMAGLLAACGSGSDSGGSTASPSVRNDLISQVDCDSTIAKTVGHYVDGDAITTITPNGLVFFYDMVQRQALAGCASESGNTLSGSLNFYDTGVKAGSGNFTAAISETTPGEPTITGSATIDGDAYPFALSYSSEFSDQSAAVSLLAPKYDDAQTTPDITVTVDQASKRLVLNSRTTGCSLSADITIPDSTVNLYMLSRYDRNCAGTVTSNYATGFALRVDSMLYLVYVNNSRFSTFYLRTTPSDT